MFKVHSQTNRVGLLVHSVRTSDRELALSLFGHSLDLDDQAQLLPIQGGYCVTFCSSQSECNTALLHTQSRASTTQVGHYLARFSS